MNAQKSLILFIQICCLFLLNCSEEDSPPLNIVFHQEHIEQLIQNTPAGGIANLPAGKIILTTQITVKTGILLIGAGTNQTFVHTGSSYAFRMEGDTNDRILISGIHFIGNEVDSRGIYMRSDSTNFRISGCVFSKYLQAINIYQINQGLIDHCSFINNGTSILVSETDDDAAWNKPVTLGSEKAVYIEDCYFHYEKETLSSMYHSIVGGHGARYVFRYNNLFYTMNGSPIDAHGNFFWGRGTVSYEIYSNRIKIPENRIYYGMYLRGGSGVVFDNSFTGRFALPICLANYKSFRSSTGGTGPTNYGETDYPCIDQINNLYIWNNTTNGALMNAIIQDRGWEQTHIQEGRDYFHSTAPTYVPLTYPHPSNTNLNM